MTTNIQLSFILPCHNVGTYIESCLSSIYESNINNNAFEVICVDDVSTDDTCEKIELHQNLHKNIVLIRHKINKASGGARNTGLKAAKGKFIWFVDPDDLICSDNVKPMLEKCEKNNLDILCFNYQNINERKELINAPEVFNDTSVKIGLDFVKDVFGDEIVYHLGYIWRFIYKRDFLLRNNMFFPENITWQDTVYMARPLFLQTECRGHKNSGINIVITKTPFVVPLKSNILATKFICGHFAQEEIYYIFPKS